MSDIEIPYLCTIGDVTIYQKEHSYLLLSVDQNAPIINVDTYEEVIQHIVSLQDTSFSTCEHIYIDGDAANFIGDIRVLNSYVEQSEVLDALFIDHELIWLDESELSYNNQEFETLIDSVVDTYDLTTIRRRVIYEHVNEMRLYIIKSAYKKHPKTAHDLFDFIQKETGKVVDDFLESESSHMSLLDMLYRFEEQGLIEIGNELDLNSFVKSTFGFKLDDPLDIRLA